MAGAAGGVSPRWWVTGLHVSATSELARRIVRRAELIGAF
jgi:hypothetical protein